MKELRPLCWFWIVAATMLILLVAPVSVTRRDAKDTQLTRIEWIGPFTEPYAIYRVTKSSIDFSRLIVALLVVNLLPAVVLWQHNGIVHWWEHRQRVSSDQAPSKDRTQRGIAFAKTMLVVFFVVCGLGIYKAAVYPPPKSSIHNQAQTHATSSPPAVATSQSNSTVPVSPGFTLDATPTPVRRAIPVDQQAAGSHCRRAFRARGYPPTEAAPLLANLPMQSV
jgi:hypothetical protein